MTNPSIFHAVALPDSFAGDETPCATDLVFGEFDKALEVIRKIKRSRLRSFQAYDEALAFASTRVAEAESRTTLSDAERQSIGNFKSLAPRDLTKLRLAIERRTCEEFRELIHSNPRYLISSADTAVVLMEGPRYNAAHIAAKADKPHMLRILLDTISDRAFIRMLYPTDDQDTLDNRLQVLLDCYLNTPDKGACDTPLHFASKFGSKECVKLLLSYPLCDTNKVNNQQKKASEIICERKGDQSVKDEITQLFANQYFVPVIRTDDDLVIVNQPCKGFTPSKNTAAVAGPTSPELARELYTYLKSPARKGKPSVVRLTDPVKGLERDASSKCQEIGVKWAEYWEFLGDSIDLSSEEGLDRLEQHFRKVYSLQSESSFKAEKVYEVLNESTSPISSICLEMESLSLNSFTHAKDSDRRSASNFEAAANSSSEDEELFYTPPSSPAFEIEFFVYGLLPSRCDRYAYRAIKHMNISSTKYPYVSNWWKRMPLLDLNTSLASTPNKFSRTAKVR